MSERILVVNADDFGRSPGVNSGIIRAHEEGIVTSATLMVRWPAAEDAAAYARRGELSVGLHVDLGEWAYREGEWQQLYEVIESESAEAIAAELQGQLERFERLVGRQPTHLDSHQHVHRKEPARTALLRSADQLKVPVRHLTPGIAYSGAFYGQDSIGEPMAEAISVSALIAVIEDLPAGVTELGCHPASADDHDTMYRRERLRELETLCDPRVRAALDRAGVTLRSFAQLAAA
ncbi:MAG: ChbG/HpnK family deacetylase [Actinomycetota bacterium]|nr:ChbG/HpnK family deacetylase [Actinomycetota bacterium]